MLFVSVVLLLFVALCRPVHALLLKSSNLFLMLCYESCCIMFIVWGKSFSPAVLNLPEFNIMLLYFIVLRVKAMRPSEHRHNVQL